MLGRRTREEIVKWNRITTLRFQTWGKIRHPGPLYMYSELSENGLHSILEFRVNCQKMLQHAAEREVLMLLHNICHDFARRRKSVVIETETTMMMVMGIVLNGQIWMPN